MREHQGQREVIELADGDVLLERDIGIRATDGCRLSCDVYRPARSERSPALLEHIPYRKDDLHAADDRTLGIFMAREGFATVRLDVRGTGNSEGIAQDEYTREEQRDGVAAVAWIARQPWCTGKVGSWGMSYGGFTCIQLAALQPPELRAIAPVFATDDRYTDDMHFSGGALCALELAHYPLRILAMNALPPARRVDEGDEAFRVRWLERIDATPPWILRWLDEQHDGPYWRNGSLRHEYARVRCPALIVAGWRDGYRTAMLRLAGSLSTGWELLAGPWMHTMPDRGIPEPQYPFMAEMLQWFRRHLGVASEPTREGRPRTVFFVTEFDPPSRPPARVSGSWFASDQWPDQRGPVRVLYFSTEGHLSDSPPSEAARLDIPFGPSVGVTSGNWCPPPPGHGLPADQRADDARSVVFTSSPLQDPVDVFGQPVAYLRVEHPGPSALVSVKLSEVSASGETQLVTSGLLNLAHRHGHQTPEPFSGAGDVRVDLQATGWSFRPGHRVRIAVAGSDWPMAWPLPTTDPVALHVGPDVPCRVELPGLPSDAVPFASNDRLMDAPDRAGWTDIVSPSTWRIVADPLGGTSGIEASDAGRVFSPAEGVRVDESRRYRAFISDADPLGAEVEGEASLRLIRRDISVRSVAQGRFTATADAFLYDVRLDVREGFRLVHERRWRGRVQRRLC
jgi:putative CocE/NonD family hydrolase